MKNKFNQLYQKLTSNLSGYQSFDSLLSIFIYWLNAGGKDTAHLSECYFNEKQKEIAFEMFKLFGEIADNHGQGLYDHWGDFYMGNYSNKHTGQFFTPQAICDLMAQITIIPSNKRQTVADPCCGSARMILAAAKVDRNILAYCADIDLTCVKMAIINLAINSIPGFVCWMDSISLDIYRQYEI